MSRLNDILDRHKREKDLDAELRFHFESLVAQNVRAGMNEQAARRAARLEFGGVEQIKEDCRDVRTTQWIENRSRDFRFALRQMRRNLGFTLAAILTLALGLGSTTAMFSVVDGVLLRPLQFPEPDRLYLANMSRIVDRRTTRYGPVNARHFYEWRTHCSACEEVALAGPFGATLSVGDTPERVPGLGVSFNFFRTFGVQPRMGRDFLREEELPGSDHVVILSDSLWRSRFAGDRSIIGRRILVNGEPSEVVGVMPSEVHLPRGEQWGAFFAFKESPEIFKPLGLAVGGMPGIGAFNYFSLVRLKPGATAANAASEMNALIADYRHQRNFDSEVTVISLRERVTGTSRFGLWLLFSIAAAVLLIACINVGNLLLVRTIAREREASVRLALGSSAAALVRLVLAELMLLVLAGGALGLVFALGAVHLFQMAAPIELPRLDELQISWRVLLFATGAMVCSTLLCATVPAYRLSRTALQGSFQSATAKSTDSLHRFRIREVMVGAEVALSVALLIITGLLGMSYVRLKQVDPGLVMDQLIVQGVALTSPGYQDDAARNRFIAAALQHVSAIPGAKSVAVVSQLPFTGENSRSSIFDPDGSTGASEATVANFRYVDAAYRETMGIPLRRGRFLQVTDENPGSDHPVGVISERTAQWFWPNQNPIGKRLRTVSLREPAFEVVGVVGDVLAAGPETQPPITIYQPYLRAGMNFPIFVIRTWADPRAVMAPIQSLLRSIDPTVALLQTRTLEDVAEETVQARRFQLHLAAAFALAAITLASLGIYGVISFTVARRTRELGIRMALGARTGQIMRMIMRQGMRPVLAGLIAGTSGALLIGDLLEGKLFAISPHDPITILSVLVLLFLVASFACYIPARRAIRINPTEALRWD